MKGTRSKSLAACLALATAGLTFVGTAAFAQPQTEQIIVSPQFEGYGPMEGPDRVYFTQAVSFADLDLRTDWGARTLGARIGYAAAEDCRLLDRYYPDSTPMAQKASRRQSCVTNAIYGAQPQVTAVIYAVRQ